MKTRRLAGGYREDRHNMVWLVLLCTMGAPSEGQAFIFATAARRFSPNHTHKLSTPLFQKVPIVFYTRVAVGDVNRQDVNKQGFP
jgi:hypothetical protein